MSLRATSLPGRPDSALPSCARVVSSSAIQKLPPLEVDGGGSVQSVRRCCLGLPSRTRHRLCGPSLLSGNRALRRRNQTKTGGKVGTRGRSFDEGVGSLYSTGDGSYLQSTLLSSFKI